MTWFVSRREGRLWTGVVAMVLTISASAAFAGALVDVLRPPVLVGGGFTAGLVLAIAAVLALAFRGAQRAEYWLALALLAAVAMIAVRSGISALERTHLFEYGLLSVVLYEALTERRSHGRPVPFPAFTAIATAAFLGWLDEAVQALVPDRVYDLRDVGINALAAGVAVLAVATLRWARRRRAA